MFITLSDDLKAQSAPTDHIVVCEPLGSQTRHPDMVLRKLIHFK